MWVAAKEYDEWCSTSCLLREDVVDDAGERIIEMTGCVQVKMWRQAANQRCDAGLDDETGTCCRAAQQHKTAYCVVGLLLEAR